MASLTELSDRDKAILRFEASHVRMTGRKEEAIRKAFNLHASRYFQILNELIDTPAAVKFDPQLISRLHRERARRTEARANREFSNTSAR